MTLTQKEGRGAVVVDTAKDILESDPEIVASGVKKKEDDKNLEKTKRDKAIAEWIGQRFKSPSRNEDEEDEDEEEDVGAPLTST